MGLKKYWRRAWVVLVICPHFFAVLLTKKGLFSHDGRMLVIGKIRRILLSSCPPLSRYLHQRYGLNGGCTNCGASCKLLFQCPHWDDQSKLCNVYEDRPNICRLFPITPADLRDRDIVSRNIGCGFKFSAPISSKEQY